MPRDASHAREHDARPSAQRARSRAPRRRAAAVRRELAEPLRARARQPRRARRALLSVHEVLRMRPLDWAVLFAALAGIVGYGVWKGRRTRDLDDFLVADRRLRWHHVALSIMATQASAVTFLATPGQAYADGMRFVQVYFGLPVAMVILSATAVPLYHRLKVYTAYEYLEGRFDLKTRTLAAFLFLMLRGLSTGVSLYAPPLILSLIMGWVIRQFIFIMGGMVVAFITIVRLLPADVSFLEAAHVAGKLGRLNAVDFSFDVKNQYNFWSGLVGGCFLALSYFGTDQSQVQRYLTGESAAQSRRGLRGEAARRAWLHRRAPLGRRRGGRSRVRSVEGRSG